MGMVSDWVVDLTTSLVGKLKDAAGGIVGKFLATFGLTTLSFKTVLPQVKEFVLQYVGQLPGSMLDFLSYLGVGTAMTMILSALSVRLAWKIFVVPKAVADQIPGAGS